MTDRLLTTRQVAERLGVSAETVLRWVETRGLPARRLTSRAIRYIDVEVDAWVEAHATAGDATEEVSPAPNNATRRLGVSSLPSPVPPLDAATTEEN